MASSSEDGLPNKDAARASGNLDDKPANPNMNKRKRSPSPTVNTSGGSLSVGQRHALVVYDLCRVCGTSQLNKPVNKSKKHYAEALRLMFNIDVMTEVPLIYPERICRGCELRCERFMKKQLQKSNTELNMQQNKYRTDIKYFSAHSGSDCTICLSTTNTEETLNLHNFFPCFQYATLSERISFLEHLISVLTSLELETVAFLIARSQLPNVQGDALSVANKYKDRQFLIDLELREWLNNRNQILIKFLLGFAPSVQDTKELCNYDLSMFAYMLEIVYNLSSGSSFNIVLPVSFLMSLFTYRKTNSKQVIDMFARCSPGGCYKTIENYLVDGSMCPVTFPKTDNFIIIDNEQVVRYCRILDAEKKSSTSVITMTAYIVIDDTELQKDMSLSPCAFSSSANVNEMIANSADSNKAKYQEMKGKVETAAQLLIECDSPYFQKLQQAHEEQFRRSIRGALDDIVDDSDKDNATPVNQGQTTMEPKYGHVESNHDGSKPIILVDPASFSNPNSAQNLAEVLRNIGRANGLARYGGNGDKSWIFLCVDGLPHVLISHLIDEAVVCRVHNCNKSFLAKEKYVAHHNEVHGNEPVQYFYEFDWIYLLIGAGHLEHNALKAFISLCWTPFFIHICDLLKFSTAKAKEFVKSATDHHLSWKLLLIFYEAYLCELVSHYVKETSSQEIRFTVDGFLEFCRTSSTPNMTYVMSMLRYAQAIINMRMAVRRNNFILYESSKLIISELFFARNHPFYQKIIIWDYLQYMQMPSAVRQVIEMNVSATVTGDPAKGQGFDYLLEEKNREVKEFIAKNVTPSNDTWVRLIRNNQLLHDLVNKARELFGAEKETDFNMFKVPVRDVKCPDAEAALRGSIRSSSYLNQHGQSNLHSMMLNLKKCSKLHSDLANFEKLAVDNRNTYILSKVLNVTPKKEQKILFTTMKEEDEYNMSTIARLTTSIQDFIRNLAEPVKELMSLRLKKCRLKLDFVTLYSELHLMSVIADSARKEGNSEQADE